MRGHAHEHVHVIRGKVAFDDLDVQLLTYFSDEVSCPPGYFCFQDPVTVFRDPDQVVLGVIDGVRCPSIIQGSHHAPDCLPMPDATGVVNLEGFASRRGISGPDQKLELYHPTHLAQPTLYKPEDDFFGQMASFHAQVVILLQVEIV